MVAERETAGDRIGAGEREIHRLGGGERRQTLHLLHDTQVSIEKARIAIGNRISALERGADEAATPLEQEYFDLFQQMEEWEDRFEGLMAEQAQMFPVWDHWLRHVKGIGPALGSQMLAMLLPPLPDRGPSTWYKAAGLTVEARPDGTNRLPRARKARCPKCNGTTFRQKGEVRTCTECETVLPPGTGKITFYPRLRRCLHNVAESFVRNGGYYREAYDQRKARLVERHAGDPEWPPHRLDSVARWSMTKLFLAHLWEMWLDAEGQTGRRAYVIEVLGHPHYEPPPIAEKGKKV